MFRDELQSLVEGEMDITAQVAVCIAAGYSAANTRLFLAITQAEYVMARQRIETLATRWRQSEC